MGWFADRKEARKYKDRAFPCRHVSGLDMKEGARVRVKMLEDRFVFRKGFESDGLNVAKSRIRSISKESEEWIEVHAPGFSNFRAVLGVAVLGPLGALLGMPMKEPYEVERKKDYLVFKLVDGDSIVLYCDTPVARIGDLQSSDTIVKDFERGVGYAR